MSGARCDCHASGPTRDGCATGLTLVSSSELADLADLQGALAQAYLDTGRRDLALEASKVFEENQDPRLRGNMRLLLARIVRDPARAKALATSARADFVSANKPMLVAKADELLATLR